MRQHPTGSLQDTLLEVFNAGRTDLADRLVAPDYIEHALPPGAPGGLPALLAYLEHIRTAFPDLRLTVEDAVEQGDRLALRLSATGTHLGPLRGMAATGRRAEWEEMHFFRLEGGRIAEHWIIAGTLGMLRQLGLVQVGGPA